MNAAIYSLFISLALRMSVICVFVMLIKSLFRDKLSAAAHCSIWLILLLQSLFCICNVRIPTKASIYNVMPELSVQNAAPAAAPAAPDIRNLIALLYVAGVLLLLLWYVAVFVIHSIKVARSEQITDKSVLSVLKDTKAMLDIRGRITVRRGSYAHMLYHTVVLPEGYTEDEQRQILLHELCHYRHRDNLKLWAAVAVISLNWFNPLVWFAFKRFRADIEMHCDDSVIKLTGSRKGYAVVLVKTACDHIRFIPGTSSAACGKHEVTKRVKRIALWKKKKPIWLVIAMMASVCISCLCLTDAVSVAVENTVYEAVSTPEPVSSVSQMLESVVPQQPEPEPAAPTVQPRQHSAATARPTVPEPAQSAPAAAAEQARGTEAPPPSPPQASEDAYGTIESVSANGSKETYSRDDGSTVVLQYDDDGDLLTGYIIDNGE